MLLQSTDEECWKLSPVLRLSEFCPISEICRKSGYYCPKVLCDAPSRLPTNPWKGGAASQRPGPGRGGLGSIRSGSVRRAARCGVQAREGRRRPRGGEAPRARRVLRLPRRLPALLLRGRTDWGWTGRQESRSPLEGRGGTWWKGKPVWLLLLASGMTRRSPGQRRSESSVRREGEGSVSGVALVVGCFFCSYAAMHVR